MMVEAIINSLVKFNTYKDTDIETAYMHARKSLELIAKDVYDLLNDYEPTRNTLDEILQDIQLHNHIDEDILNAAYEIKRIGNIATHEELVPEEDIEESVFCIASWYFMEHYEGTIDDRLGFLEPYIEMREENERKQKLEKLFEERDNIHDEIQTLMSELEDLKLRLQEIEEEIDEEEIEEETKSQQQSDRKQLPFNPMYRNDINACNECGRVLSMETEYYLCDTPRCKTTSFCPECAPRDYVCPVCSTKRIYVFSEKNRGGS